MGSIPTSDIVFYCANLGFTMPNLENYLGFHNENIRIYRHRNLTVTADKKLSKDDAVVEWSGDIGCARGKLSEVILTGTLKFKFKSDKVQKLSDNQLDILKEINYDLIKFWST